MNEDLSSPSDTQGKLPQIRSEALEQYDSIYLQQGWCSLWAQLSNDGLVEGDCPQSVITTAKEDIVMNNGLTENLTTAVQLTISSAIEVKFPACINYGIDAEYAILSGGRIQEWTVNSNIATDVTILPTSTFSLYFRCDHIAWR